MQPDYGEPPPIVRDDLVFFTGFYDGNRLQGTTEFTFRANRHLTLATEWSFNDVSLPADRLPSGPRRVLRPPTI